MKNRLYLLKSVLLAGLIILAGCSNDEEEPKDKDIELTNPKESAQTGFADEDSTGGGFTFTAKSTWTATVTETSAVQNGSRATSSGVDWLRLLVNGAEAYKGDAGTIKMTIEMDTNYSGDSRKAKIVIISGSDDIVVEVTQNGKKEDGTVPEIPRLVTQITGNNNGYMQLPSCEFKYDAKTFQLKEIHLKRRDYTDIYKYDYGILNEIKVTDDEGVYYTGKFGNNGYINKVENSDSYLYYDLRDFTYDSNGYLNTHLLGDDGDPERESYKYIWENGNLIHILDDWEEGDDEEVDKPFLLYTSELNDKTTIDLNVFFFETVGVYSAFRDSDYGMHGLHFFALIDKAGKRSKNYIKRGPGLDSLVDAISERELYTAETEPEIGAVLWSTNYEEIGGDASYLFDSDNYPVSFSQRIVVTKTENIYKGKREYQEPANEQEKEHWEHIYGAGPWFRIKTTQKTYAPVSYTYKFTISYNR